MMPACQFCDTQKKKKKLLLAKELAASVKDA